MVIQRESLKKSLILSGVALALAILAGVGFYIFQRQKPAPLEEKKAAFQPMPRDLSHLSLERTIPGGAALSLSLENLPQEVKRFSESNLYQSAKAYFEKLKAGGDLELEKEDTSGKGTASILMRLTGEGGLLSRSLQMAGERARLAFYAPQGDVAITTETPKSKMGGWLFVSELSTASPFFQNLQKISSRGLSVDEAWGIPIQMEGEEFFHTLASSTWLAASNLTLLKEAIDLLQGATSTLSLAQDSDFSSVAGAAGGKAFSSYLYIQHEKIFRMQTGLRMLKPPSGISQYRASWTGLRWEGGLLSETATSLTGQRQDTGILLAPASLTLPERFPKGALYYAWGRWNPQRAFQEAGKILKNPMMEQFLPKMIANDVWLSEFEKRCLPLLSDEFGYAVMDLDVKFTPSAAVTGSGAILLKSSQPKKLERALLGTLKAAAKSSSLKLKSRKYKKVKIKSLPFPEPFKMEVAVARLENTLGLFVGPPGKTAESFVDVLKNEAASLSVAGELRFKGPLSHAFYIDLPRVFQIALGSLSQNPMLSLYLANPGISLLKNIFQSLLPSQGVMRLASDGMMGEFHLGLKDLDRGQWDKIFVDLDAQLAKPKRRWREQKAKRRLMEIRQAVADYRGEKRQYPQSLRHLVPRYISEIPMEPLTRKAVVVSRPDGKGGWVFDKDRQVYPNLFGTDLTGIPYSQWGKMP